MTTPNDENGLPIGYVDWYNSYFRGQPVDTGRDNSHEAAWRAALEAVAQSLPEKNKPWTVGEKEHFKAAAELVVQREAEYKDAARYRFLREWYEVSASRHGLMDLLALRSPIPNGPEIMDAFVDEAMQEADHD